MDYLKFYLIIDLYYIYYFIFDSFYLINVTASDNERIDSIKYAKGNQTKEYFNSNGYDVVNNQIRVEENGIYTVYVSDASGNSTIQTIEITNII